MQQRRRPEGGMVLHWIPGELAVVLESPIPRSVSISLVTHPSRNQPTSISEFEGQGPNLGLLVSADSGAVGVGGITFHIATGAGPLSVHAPMSSRA